MKTAGRENPNHWAKVSSNRAHGAADQNRSCSIKWAAKQEKVRPLQECFFLTFLFIELIRSLEPTGGIFAPFGWIAAYHRSSSSGQILKKEGGARKW
jgi:hypothetical protein